MALGEVDCGLMIVRSAAKNGKICAKGCCAVRQSYQRFRPWGLECLAETCGNPRKVKSK